MIYDYIANQINQNLIALETLGKHEKEAKNSNGNQRRQAEDQATKVRQSLLSDATAIHSFFEVSELANFNEFRATWQNYNKNVKIPLEKAVKQLYEEVFETPKIDLAKLLPYSFVVQFRFTLAQPYISRDEANFYIIDNPVRKDKIFGLPYVAPTSWKGSLRAALYKMGQQAKDAQVKRLFGNDKEVEEPGDLQAGRLYFFPTFFTQKSLEIINPHDRSRQVGKNPILIESVPIGAEGVFTLLYLPFNSPADKDTKSLVEQVTEDLELVVEALQKMLCEYGFGAKTSSGFGLVSEKIKGNLYTKDLGLRPSEKIPTIKQAKPEVDPANPWAKLAEFKPENSEEQPEAELKKGPELEKWSFANFEELKRQVETLKAQVQ